jgi:hypothetical protein
MVGSLAPAREEAAKIMRALESDTNTESTVNEQITYRAILAVSLVVVMDAALFFVMIDEEYRRMTGRFALKWERRQWRLAFQKAENALRDAKTAEEREEYVWNTRQDRKDALGRAIRSRSDFLMAQLPAPSPDKPKPLQETIDELLTPSLSRIRERHSQRGWQRLTMQSSVNGLANVKGNLDE